MKKVPFLLTVLGLLFGVLAFHGRAAAPKKETVETLMKKKLVQSQKVLEGLALHDYDKIVKHGEELLFIGKQAEWKVLTTPLYETYSNEFRSNVEDLIKNAKKKNIDAVALSYVDLTLTCVKCHKHVREKQTPRRER